MADEERKILIDVEVGKDFDQEIGKVNSELEQNKKLINELKKDYSANAAEIAKLEAKNRTLADSKKQLVKESQTESNSLDALRLRLAKLTKERNSTNVSTKEGAARFKELQKEIKGTTDEIKAFEEEGGDFRRNVGNYPQLLDNATGGFITLFKTLLTNPIGIIITALTSLIAVFAKTQTGMEFFRKSGAFLNTVLGKLSDIVEALGARMIEAFSNPQQALSDLVTNIKEGIVKYFTEFIPNAISKVIEGFGLLGKAAKQLFTGDFSRAADTALEGVVKLGDGIIDLNPGTAIIRALAVEIKELAIESNKAANEAFRLEAAMIANEKAQANLQVEVAKSKVQFLQLKTASDDITKSTQERIKSAKAAFDLENEQLNKQIALQEERINILKAQNDLTNSTEEDLQKVRDAEIALATLQEASLNKQLEIRNKLNGLIQQEITLKEQLLERDKVAGEELEIFLLEQEEKLIEAEGRRREILLSNEELTQNERALIIAQSEAKINGIREKNAKEEKARAKAVKDFKTQQEQEALNAALALFGEWTVAGRALALTQIGFDTAKAISSLTANSEANPANAVTFGGAGIIQFVTGLLRIGANILKAKQVLTGGGSGGTAAATPSPAASAPTSASQPQGLSNVNGTILSQFGSNARSAAQDREAISQGIASMPPIYVAVTEINKGQNNVKVKESEASLG